MIYYHNPNCTKSKQGLAYLEEKGLQPTIVTYLDTPLETTELEKLFRLTTNDPNSLVRVKEASDLGLSATTDAEWIPLIQANPILLERPILVTKTEALIGRPHDLMRAFIDRLTQ